MATVACLSKYQFARLFKATYGLTPMEYVSGVEFIQPPAHRPYGTEALCRDNSGNWLVLVQPTSEPYTAADFT